MSSSVYDLFIGFDSIDWIYILSILSLYFTRSYTFLPSFATATVFVHASEMTIFEIKFRESKVT